MEAEEQRLIHPELKLLVADASRALARLDRARLEELALSCQALNRDIEPMSPDDRQELARQAQEAQADMAVFSRVLDATRANMRVMNRLRVMRAGQLEYSEGQARGGENPELEQAIPALPDDNAGSPSPGPERPAESAEGGHGDH